MIILHLEMYVLDDKRPDLIAEPICVEVALSVLSC